MRNQQFSRFKCFFIAIFATFDLYTSGVINRRSILAVQSAQRVRLFTESTGVYGDYFVIIEQCTLDTKTI